MAHHLRAREPVDDGDNIFCAALRALAPLERWHQRSLWRACENTTFIPSAPSA
jgi:hypothetical protein